jgi:hypothetical protein
MNLSYQGITPYPDPAATDGRPYAEELETLLDRLADLLDKAHTQALQDPTLPDLPNKIRRGWEHVKLVIRRLEEDLAPLDPSPD